jgi:hypothetical protein
MTMCGDDFFLFVHENRGTNTNTYKPSSTSRFEGLQTQVEMIQSLERHAKHEWRKKNECNAGL